jgi:signal-transduction protein with cAMP-binding, CBS, and nucleotidyltransferase domain
VHAPEEPHPSVADEQCTTRRQRFLSEPTSSSLTLQSKVRKTLVSENGKVVGLVSVSDLLDASIDDTEAPLN